MATCQSPWRHPQHVSHAWTLLLINHFRDTPTCQSSQDMPTLISHASTSYSCGSRPPVNHCGDIPTLIGHLWTSDTCRHRQHPHPSIPMSHAHITRQHPHAHHTITMRHAHMPVIPETRLPITRHCPLTVSPGPASRRTRMRGMGGNRRANTDFLRGKQRDACKSAYICINLH